MNNDIPKTLVNHTSTQFFIGQKKVIKIMLCLTTLLGSPLATSEELSETQRISSGSGMINRAPLVSSEFQPSNLDRISTDISNITESLSNILTSPIEEEILEEKFKETIIEPSKTQTIVTKPQKLQPEKVKNLVKKSITPKPLKLKTVPQAVANKVAQPKPHPKQSGIELANKTKNIDRKKKPKQIIYLKHDENGDIVANNTLQWHCIEDTQNGLMWEVKSSDGGIRDKNNSYSWFQPTHETPPTQKYPGSVDQGRCSGNTACDTYSYIQAINGQGFCGYSDWRLPTRDEMLSIISFENKKSLATINDNYFPETMPSWYWTSSSNKKHPEHAWYVLFRNGIALNDLKERPKHIRLVRTQATES